MVLEARSRIRLPHHRLTLVALDKVLDTAGRVTAAILEAAKQTTKPFDKPIAQTAASHELDVFVNVFRDDPRPQDVPS